MDPFPLKRKKDWTGLKVESRTALQNGLGRLPAGAIFVVRASHHKTNLESVRCPHCGVQFFIRGVDTSELIPRFDLTDIEEMNKVRRVLNVDEYKEAP